MKPERRSPYRSETTIKPFCPFCGLGAGKCSHSHYVDHKGRHHWTNQRRTDTANVGRSTGERDHPSYRARLPEPMIVVHRDEDGSVLDSSEACDFGHELGQEILRLIHGKVPVYPGSYLTIEREE